MAKKKKKRETKKNLRVEGSMGLLGKRKEDHDVNEVLSMVLPQPPCLGAEVFIRGSKP